MSFPVSTRRARPVLSHPGLQDPTGALTDHKLRKCFLHDGRVTKDVQILKHRFWGLFLWPCGYSSLLVRLQRQKWNKKKRTNWGWFVKQSIETHLSFWFYYLHIFGSPDQSSIPFAVAGTIPCFAPLGISSSDGSLNPLPWISAFLILYSKHHNLTAGLDDLS